MSFDPNDPKITAYVFGELSDSEKSAFESEMESSEELRRAVDDTRQTVDALASELEVEPSMHLSDEQREAVSEQIDKSDADRTDERKVSLAPKSRKTSSRWLVRICKISVSVVLVVGLGLLILPTMQQSRNAATKVHRTEIADSGSREPSPAPTSRLTNSLADIPVEMSRSSRRELKEERLKRPATTPLAKSPSMQFEASDSLRLGVGQRDLSRLGEKMEVTIEEPGKPVAMDLNFPKQKNAVYVPLFSYSGLEGISSDRGVGPGQGGDKYSLIVENPFKEVKNEPLSTFSIDVDTASYAKVRMYLMQHNTLPRPDAVRIEELVNYFTYDYEPPTDDTPFAAHVEVASCPWRPEHRLVRVGIKGKEIARENRPTSNLVFLLDVSGSMKRANKLPLLKRGMKMLADQLSENDRVAIVVYAGAAGLVLESTPGDQKQTILDALDRLHAGGSTNGGQGVTLAYQTALDNFVKGGVNRVILCTDGDFNVGVTGTDELVRLAEKNAKTGVFLSVLGFGMGNHNDAMLEQISNKGNGNYAYIDTDAEARKVLVEQMSGTLVTIAKDVKIQIEFNPAEVAAYRLIGYENRCSLPKTSTTTRRTPEKSAPGTRSPLFTNSRRPE